MSKIQNVHKPWKTQIDFYCPAKNGTCHRNESTKNVDCTGCEFFIRGSK